MAEEQGPESPETEEHADQRSPREKALERFQTRMNNTAEHIKVVEHQPANSHRVLVGIASQLAAFGELMVHLLQEQATTEPKPDDGA